MSAIAYSKGVKISPRKVSTVAKLVKNRSVEDALVILENTPRKAALPVSKTIKSASSNASNNHGYKKQGLRIVEISVTPGVRYKRFRPVSRGSAHPFQRKTSNIRVVVDGDKKIFKKKAPAKVKKEKE